MQYPEQSGVDNSGSPIGGKNARVAGGRGRFWKIPELKVLRARCQQMADIVAKVRNCPALIFPAVKRSDRRPPIDVASITLPGSPASFSSDDEVPHIFTWKSPVQPKEILIASAKRLLQQNRRR